MTPLVPNVAVANKIATIAGLTVGVNVFAGPVMYARDGVPVKAVFVDSSAGLMPQPYLGSGTSFFQKYLNVYTRDRTSDGSLDLMLEIQQVLNLSDLGPGFTACFQSMSEIYSGMDRQDHHIYRAMYRVDYEE